MYPQPRESKSKFSRENFENVITAEFVVPSGKCGIKEGVRVYPVGAYRHGYPHPKTFSGSVDVNAEEDGDTNNIPFFLRLDFNESTWKLDIDHNWLYNLSQLIAHQNLIRGSIHFRCISFGNWEPIEFLKYFVNESDVKVQEQGTRIVHSLFPVNLFATNFPEYTLEMTWKVDHFATNDMEEILLSKHRAEMQNKLLPAPPKSDFRLIVEGEEFFVHLNQIAAFSNELKAGIESKRDSKWDISDIMKKDTMQGLLRFIYYDEVDTIDSPKVAFDLLMFSYKYKGATLFKICEQKLMNFHFSEICLSKIFEIYMVCREPKEFKKLKRHFVGQLLRSSEYFGADEFNTQAEKHKRGLGKKLLKEIQHEFETCRSLVNCRDSD